MLNNYDKIATKYDFLSRMVFFKSQVNAQIHQLKYLPKGSSLLIVGGGTGWILEEISKLYPSGLQIVYVEISAKMIALSKQRNFAENDVEFINLSIEEFETSSLFDVILTPFLFDNFSKVRIKYVFTKLSALLKPAGLWFLVDFCVTKQKGKWWKLLLLKAMYLLFEYLSNVEASELIDMKPYFIHGDYVQTKEKEYYAGFIKAYIFKKL